jgi:hypothetical protein
MPPTAIYRLSPIAAPDDPAFDLARNQGTVVVRAISAGDARVVAAQAEAVAAGKRADIITTQFTASAFLDGQIYSVDQIEDARFPTDGERGLLEGMLAPGPTAPQATAHLQHGPGE